MADKLNDEINTGNMKKLRVNAQVTAINTIVEMTGTITYIIILAIMRGNNFNSFIYTQFFYSILLPFIFLSNTSENKDRIVEAGWKNVMKNIIDSIKKQMYANLKFVAEKLSVTNMERIQEQILNNRVSIETISTNENRMKPESKNEIFITRVVQNEITAKTMNELNVPTYEDEQSCIKSLPSEYSEASTSKDPKSTTYENLDAYKLLLNDSNHSIKKKMIANMTKHVNFEEKYVDLFRNFIAFQEGYITKEHLISNVMKHDPPPSKSIQPSVMKKGKGGKSRSRNKSATVHPETENICTEFNKSKNVKARIELRLNLLTDAQFLNNGNDGLEELIEKIITLEESFLESN